MGEVQEGILGDENFMENCRRSVNRKLHGFNGIESKEWCRRLIQGVSSRLTLIIYFLNV